MQDLQDWLAIYLIPGLGPAVCKRLIDHFGGPGPVLRAGMKDLLQVPGMKETWARAVKHQAAHAEAELELSRVRELGITLVPWTAPLYPINLRTIFTPPVLLYVKGSLLEQDANSIAVVGARSATGYGTSVAGRLSRRLAQTGVTVVSGLARGIDTAAHLGALAGGGRTIAVLGCGLDIRYPSENARLFDQIAENGAIITEYPLGTKPEPWRFPARNRIISGLSLGVVVVEAASKSGSLITANLALEQGREVFAIPGRVDSKKSEGAHRLLQQGAKLVLSEVDILEELPLLARKKAAMEADHTPREETDPEEKAILHFLDADPKAIDDIICGVNFSAARTNDLLLRLELKGLVTVLPGRLYQKKW